MNVTTLDKRHTGYGKFKYYIDVVNHKAANSIILQRWREWCWQAFGPGIELRFAIEDNRMASIIGVPMPDRWAWQTEFGHFRIYFKEDTELSAFLFQWSR